MSNLTKQIKNSIVALSAVLLLSACGGGDSGLPETAIVEPDTIIMGTVQLGAIQDSDVTIYNYEDNIRGTILVTADAKTDLTGTFSATLKTSNKAILICATNGFYIEEASTVNQISGLKTRVELIPGQELCATVNYVSGQTMNVTLSYFTHVASGLAQYLIDNNMPVSEAIASANSRISAWLGFNIISTKPIEITLDSSISENNLNDPLKYGFLNAAVSSLVKWVAQSSGQPIFKGITSINFVQTTYDDIKADGLLDGNSSTQKVLLGTVQLTPTLYRHHLALNILSMSASQLNKSNVKLKAVSNYANSVNLSDDKIFNAEAVIDIQTAAINLTNVLPKTPGNGANLVVAGSLIEFKATVISDALISSVDFFITPVPGTVKELIGTSADKFNASVIFDSTTLTGVTPNYPDAQYKIDIVATDILGNSFTHTFSNVLVSNTVTVISNINPILNTPINGTNVTVTANVSDAFGIASVTMETVPPVVGAFSAVTLNANATQAIAILDTTKLGADGLKTIKVTAQSNQSRIPTTKEIDYLVDNTLPVATNTTLINNGIVTGIIAATGSASDQTSGIKSVDFTLRGIKSQASLLNQPNISLNINTAVGYADGPTVLEMNVYDKANNRSRKPINLIIDNNKPKINTSSPSLNTWYQNISVRGSANDNPGSGISKVQLSVDGSVFANTTYAGVSSVSIVNNVNRALTQGFHNFEILATDRAGLTTTNVIPSVGFDTVEPTFTFITVPAGANRENLTGTYYQLSAGVTPTCNVGIKTASDPGFAGTTQTGSGLHTFYAQTYQNLNGAPTNNNSLIGSSTLYFGPAAITSSYNGALGDGRDYNVRAIIGRGAVTTAETNTLKANPGVAKVITKMKLNLYTRDLTLLKGGSFVKRLYCAEWSAYWFSNTTYTGLAQVCYIYPRNDDTFGC